MEKKIQELMQFTSICTSISCTCMHIKLYNEHLLEVNKDEKHAYEFHGSLNFLDSGSSKVAF